MELLIKAIATWRISHMLVHEDGPNDSIIILRHKAKIRYGSWSPLFCLWCTSVWVAIVVSRLPKALYAPFALSGLAILFEETLGWLEHQSER